MALNSDASARRLAKGPGRPLNPLADRLALVAALEAVSAVTWFDEDTPEGLIAACKPDVLVKGEDYTKTQVVGWDIVESYGGRIALAPLIDGRSTTGVIERILEAYK